MKNTPRTDAAICKRIHTPNVFGFKEHDRVDEFVSADFARQLEVALRKIADMTRYAMPHLCQICDEALGTDVRFGKDE